MFLMSEAPLYSTSGGRASPTFIPRRRGGLHLRSFRRRPPRSAEFRWHVEGREQGGYVWIEHGRRREEGQCGMTGLLRAGVVWKFPANYSIHSEAGADGSGVGCPGIGARPRLGRVGLVRGASVGGRDADAHRAHGLTPARHSRSAR